MTEEIKCSRCGGTIRINLDFLPKHHIVRYPYCDQQFNSRRILQE